MPHVRDLASQFREVQIVSPAIVSNSDDQSGTESDLGMARRGTLICSIEKGTTGCTDIGVYTSETSSFTESSLNRVTITQDTTNSTGTVTVTSNEFDLNTTGIYVFDCKDLKRYVNIEYDGDDTDSIISFVILAHQLREKP